MHALTSFSLQFIRGMTGLFFTNLDRPTVDGLFASFSAPDFARAGAIAPETITIPAGPVQGPDGPMPHTVEPFLRKNGMPTRLIKGVVENGEGEISISRYI